MELDRLEKRIRALQARKAARAATFERVQGIDPTDTKRLYTMLSMRI